MVIVELSEEDAKLFIEFQRNFTVIAGIVGCMSALSIKDISNSSLLMDFDKTGKIVHTSITKHYRQ